MLSPFRQEEPLIRWAAVLLLFVVMTGDADAEQPAPEAVVLQCPPFVTETQAFRSTRLEPLARTLRERPLHILYAVDRHR